MTDKSCQHNKSKNGRNNSGTIVNHFHLCQCQEKQTNPVANLTAHIGCQQGDQTGEKRKFVVKAQEQNDR